MDKKERMFEEQDHPLKNTDHAFVQVGKNGEPVMPRVTAETDEKQPEKDKEGPAASDRH